VRIIDLSVGDLLYYPPHSATGVLVKFDPARKEWHYVLTSPSVKDRQWVMTSRSVVKQSSILEAIGEGRLEHYPSSIPEKPKK
jgi:hypothetical protein